MRLKLFLGLLITLTLAYTGFWYYAAGQAPDRINAILQELKAKSIRLSHDALSISGFPFRFIASFASPRAELGPQGKGLSWQASAMDAYAQPWNLNHLILSSGPSAVTWQDNSLNADKMRTSMVTDNDELTRLSIELTNTRATNVDTGPILSARTMGFHMRGRPVEAAAPSGNQSLLKPVLMDVAYGAQELKLASSEAPDSRLTVLDELLLVATLRGDALPEYSTQGLGAWRDEGGTLEISSLKLSIAGIELDASGSLSLDQQLRPLGALSARVPNTDAAMTIVEALSPLNDDARRAVRTSFQLLEKFSENGGIPIALTAQNGSLWLGPLELAQMSPVVR